jgi:hypothetical protein
MTPRSLANARVRLALVALLAGGSLLALGGCDPRTLAYFLQPFEPTIPPPCETSFEGKKVVILCRAVSDSLGEYSSLERDLTREVASIFRKKIKKITVVDPDKVATWVEAHPKETDPAEVARDFDADIVVFLEVEHFETQNSGDLNMLHGMARVHVKAYEMDYPKNSKDKPIKDQPKEANELYDGYAEPSFPDRGPIPIDNGSSRSKFRITFVKVVAKEISWHFIEHAPDDSIQDSRIEH